MKHGFNDAFFRMLKQTCKTFTMLYTSWWWKRRFNEGMCSIYSFFGTVLLEDWTNIFVTTYLSITLLGRNVVLFCCLKFKNIFETVFFSLYLCIHQQSQNAWKHCKKHIWVYFYPRPEIWKEYIPKDPFVFFSLVKHSFRRSQVSVLT